MLSKMNNMLSKLNNIINRNMANTLFFKLYTSITAVIIGSIVFVSVFVSNMDDLAFVEEANFAVKVLNDFVEGSEQWDMEVNLINRFTGFSIQTLSAKQVLQYHQQHELFDIIDLNDFNNGSSLPIGIGKKGVNVYRHDGKKGE